MAQGIVQITQMITQTNQALDQIARKELHQELKHILREKESLSVALAQSVAHENMLSNQCRKLKKQLEEGPWRLRMLIRHPRKFFRLLWR
jgi:ABC-type nitrate/sulfonate/bicarbonate transport system ATPase subunit